MEAFSIEFGIDGIVSPITSFQTMKEFSYR